MKILAINCKQVFDIDVKRSGENPMPCPVCDNTRGHRGKKSFSWNNQERIGHCLHCGEKFVEFKQQKEQKEYAVPVWKNKTNLDTNAVKWFEGRGISQNTLNDLKIYTDTEFMPQVNEKRGVICFPFFIDDRLVNIKFRDREKNFKLVKDAELIFFNINSIKGSKNVVIVEGEMDCMSYVECGIKSCISVPNGANFRVMEYLDNYIELFDTIDHIYVATDNDLKGIELREELIRRLGQEKCLIVNFKDCKDANEYLIKYGGVALSQTIKDAVDIPVSGIVNLNSHYQDIYKLFVNGMEKGKAIDFPPIDDKITWELGRIAVVTGIPGHGKSEFVDWLGLRLNMLYDWKVAYFSPENFPVTYHYAKIASKIYGKPFGQANITQEGFEEVFEYILDNYFFIYPEDDMSFETILIKAKYLVKKRGIKILVIDPYNKIEHLRERGESETEYISRFLDKVTTFAKQMNVLVFLVAHPRKIDKNKETGLYNKPNLYDINGSANFYNKCDYGLSVFREYSNNTVTVDFIKVKFRHLGEGGAVTLRYNYNNGRYERDDYSVDKWDNTNYLHPAAKEPEKNISMPVNESFNEIKLSEDVPF